MSKKPNFSNCQKEADRLLKKYQISEPPIDPESLAESEGVDILYADFDEPFRSSVSGFFQAENDSIIVNRDIPTNRITFTIAHELGHKFLHSEYIRSSDYKPIPRENEYAGRKPIVEVEADTFAANLLVPLRILKKYAKDSSIQELAKIFLVSEEMVFYRLDLLRRYPRLAR